MHLHTVFGGEVGKRLLSEKSLDAAVAPVLSELDDISAFIKEQINNLLVGKMLSLQSVGF